MTDNPDKSGAPKSDAPRNGGNQGRVGGGKGRFRGGKGRGRGGGRGNKTWKKPPGVTVPSFKGLCRKDLLGTTLVYTSHGTTMAKEYHEFNKACQLVAGKLSGRMQTALNNKKKLK